MSDRMARCADLSMMAEVYPEDKRVTAIIPVEDFTDAVAKGDDVVLTVGLDSAWRGRPAPSTGSAHGRVKRILAEVEVDLATFKAGAAVGQGALDVEF